MKFADKLSKIRKERNLSQEQLADKLEISRQAVSKWESGLSYPDMNKMLKICEVLECKLEDIIDDGFIGEDFNTKSNNVNINEYIDKFFKYVKNSYNMFCSMSFIEKIKFIFEMVFIAVVLFLISYIIYFLITNFIERILYALLPHKISYRISSLFSIIISAILQVISTVLFLYLYKVRYLDYFITIFDNSVSGKVIEEVISDSNIKNKEKVIIIRDPNNHVGIFKIIFNILLYFIKFISFIFLAVIGILFTASIVFAFFFIVNSQYNIILAYTSFIFVGIAIILLVFIELVYNFTFNQKYNFKKLFYVGIIGLIVSGVSLALTLSKGFSMIDNNYEFKETKTLKESINYDEKTHLYLGYLYYNLGEIEYVVDEKMKEVEVSVVYPDVLNIGFYNYKESNDSSVYGLQYNEIGINDAYKIIVNNLKENRLPYDLSRKLHASVKVTIKSNSKNIEQIKSENKYEDYHTYRD